MKIGNVELTKENLMIAYGAGAVVIAIVAFAIVYMPLLARFQAKNKECYTVEKDAREARALIVTAGKIYGERVLTREDDVARAMDELAKYGKQMGINFVSIKPSEARDVQGAKYKIMSIEMDIESTDQKFSEFLGALDTLKKGLVKVKSFDIIPNKDDPSMLSASIVIDLYLSGRKYE